MLRSKSKSHIYNLCLSNFISEIYDLWFPLLRDGHKDLPFPCQGTNPFEVKGQHETLFITMIFECYYFYA